MSRLEKVSSGLPGLDDRLQGIRLGETIVWQILALEDYQFMVDHFAKEGVRAGRKVIYFRFSEAPQLLEEQPGIEIVRLNTVGGFETFTVQVSNMILSQDPGAYFVFDCMTDLKSVWAADFMVRNFFKAICPLVAEMKCVAYFSLVRRAHSDDSVMQIREASNIYSRAIRGGDDFYIHPLKMSDRRTRQMFLPHVFSADYTKLEPLMDGIRTSRYYEMLEEHSRLVSRPYTDKWEMFFQDARRAMEEGDPEDTEIYKKHMYDMLIGRDGTRERLFREHYDIRDYLDIHERMIGTGRIGGKAAGMLLSRKIIHNLRPDLEAHLEAHDSHYIGANVFYTFLIRNNWWKLWLEHKTEEGYFMAARALRSQMKYGEFPDLIVEGFRKMLDYYGQNPIIVRSSSMLEDGFGNAFAGKYDSVFCINTGTPRRRLEQFIKAVIEVYISAVDESALVYRKARGLDKAEEQMSILVQRVSGSFFGDIFMPGAAGVGYSTNAYAWSRDIDPKAGVLRIVAGLGTRAVDRTQSDYPRIANLDNPELLPNTSPDERFKFVQRNVDILDFSDNMLLTVPIEEIEEKAPKWFGRLIIEHDRQAEARMRELGRPRKIIATSCENILKNEEIVRTFREIMRTLEDIYEYPVDIEFTINFSENGEFLINLVQCRPLQTQGSGEMRVEVPETKDEDTFFRLEGNIMGGPVDRRFDLVAVVEPRKYAEMIYKDKFSVANVIEMINRYAFDNDRTLMLLGPGRWGTASPELGVPVRFAQISKVSALLEMSFLSDGLMPELSFGSHFFQDLVETRTFYGAVFEEDCGEGKASFFRPQAITDAPEIYDKIPGMPPGYQDIVKVYDLRGRRLRLVADSSERAVCFEEEENLRTR